MALIKTSAKIISTLDDACRDKVIIYELDDGNRVNVGPRMLEKYGLSGVLRGCGYELKEDDSRIDVYQDGKRIGSVPAGFNPYVIKSKSALYTPRLGDFTWNTDHWVAHKMLGMGDLQAVPGFVLD